MKESLSFLSWCWKYEYD